MKSFKPFFICIVLMFLHVSFVRAQQADRFQILEQNLVELAQTKAPGLNETAEISVTGVSLQAFLRGLAEVHRLNISVDPSLNITVVNRFTNEPVKNILLFLARKHNLDIQIIGSILSFIQYSPPEPIIDAKKRIPSIKLDSISNTVQMDLRMDSLVTVTKILTQLTGKNIIFESALTSKRVSGYIQDLTVEEALEHLAFSNDMKLKRSEDGILVLEDKSDSKKTTAQPSKNTRGQQEYVSENFSSLKIDLVKDTTGVGYISLDAVNVPIADVLKQVAERLEVNYFLYAEIAGNTTSKVKNILFDNFLDYVLHNTKYTYKKSGDLYLIGERNLSGLRTTQVVQLQHRSAEVLLDVIPSELKKDVEIKSFPELNSIILSGSGQNINEVESFIKSLDRSVPMIMIEILVVDYNKSRSTSTGIKAGLSDSVTSGGSIFPDLNYTLSTVDINNLMAQLEGFGVVNLGRVTPNFYINLKALEANKNINLRSTPKLATLNGNEATMRIGQTQYYAVSQSNIIGTQNPQTVVTQEFKEARADMSVTIKPLVSGDEQVTLDIKVELSNFTGAITTNAPPSTATRQFESMVRVKNNEMIMLGGLEEIEHGASSSGTPILSRIPILKWLFSQRTKSKRDNKLNIFIKPTIVY